MAGTNAGFSAAGFRTAIRAAMTMGLPVDASERATFRWVPAKTFAVADTAGEPYSWGATPTTTVTHADVQVPCAVQFSARPAGSQHTVLGEFDASRVVLTILDEDWAQVKTANKVVFAGNTYDIQFVAPPTGLFDVTVYSVYLQAEDES